MLVDFIQIEDFEMAVQESNPTQSHIADILGL